jgi:hypothetical protein
MVKITSNRPRSFFRLAMATSILFSSLLCAQLLAVVGGVVEIRVTDKDSGEPVAVRMHLKNQRGMPVKPAGHPFWKDHFVFDHKIELKLPAGQYTFEMERGPEFRVRSGNFTIKSGASGNEVTTMHRFVDMKKEGWWSGDLHIHRPPKDIRLLMLAEDLHIAPVITWWNKKNLWMDKKLPEPLLVPVGNQRFYHLLAGEDERGGGALLYFNLNRPLQITAAEREFPSSGRFLVKSQEFEGCHVDIEKPFWWDMPMWVASGMVDSIGLCNNHMLRSGMLANEAWGKPRDTGRFPGVLGNGLWTQNIYYRLLETGHRIPPSAGSASGVLANPVGYNRVYVHCGEKLDYAAWWKGLREGKVVVTNGPLLRPYVNDQLPGHVFKAAQGESVSLQPRLNLSLRDKVEYLEVVKNGSVIHEVRLADYAAMGGQLPAVNFKESGWLLIRAVTNNPKTYRFASTGPYYVEIGETRRISRSAARFFLEWVKERIEKLPLDDPEQREEVLKYHRAAQVYWQQVVDAGNVD